MSYTLRERQSIVADLADAESVSVDFALLQQSGMKSYMLRPNLHFPTKLEHDQRLVYELLEVKTKEDIIENRNRTKTQTPAEVTQPTQAVKQDMPEAKKKAKHKNTQA